MADPQKGLWLLPSRKRPHNLVRFCDALRAANTTTAGVILVKREELDDPVLHEGYLEVRLPYRWEIYFTDGDSQGDKIREYFASCPSDWDTSDWLGLIGDDQLVRTEHWDLKLIEWLKGWNIVSCNDDGFQVNERGGRIAGTMLWSGDLYRTVGYLFPPGLQHVYLDDIYEQLGQESGCWKFSRDARLDVVISHFHYTRGMSEKDETYSLAYDLFAQTDFPIYQNWMAQEKPLAAARIRELIQRYGAC